MKMEVYDKCNNDNNVIKQMSEDESFIIGKLCSAEKEKQKCYSK